MSDLIHHVILPGTSFQAFLSDHEFNSAKLEDFTKAVGRTNGVRYSKDGPIASGEEKAPVVISIKGYHRRLVSHKNASGDRWVGCSCNWGGMKAPGGPDEADRWYSIFEGHLRDMAE